ncbi:hypothetical protein F4802DRAFT_246339 [Xylaria palmicola]|nr:hypothetical protein F4802DRAFT_246339 [Xylaria palmicola]
MYVPVYFAGSGIIHLLPTYYQQLGRHLSTTGRCEAPNINSYCLSLSARAFSAISFTSLSLSVFPGCPSFPLRRVLASALAVSLVAGVFIYCRAQAIDLRLETGDWRPKQPTQPLHRSTRDPSLIASHTHGRHPAARTASRLPHRATNAHSSKPPSLQAHKLRDDGGWRASPRHRCREVSVGPLLLRCLFNPPLRPRRSHRSYRSYRSHSPYTPASLRLPSPLSAQGKNQLAFECCAHA